MEARPPATTCPACGAAFSHAAPTRKQRMQCPKCLHIVTLQPGKPVPVDAPLNARIELLEGRICELEQTLAELARHALPRAPFRWRSPELPNPFSEAHAEILRENLGKVPPHEIAIQAALNEPAAGRAQWLKTIFAEARWTVLESSPAQLSIPANSLALATALPVSPAMSAAYLALHASGFPLRSQFTPQGEESLIVA